VCVVGWLRFFVRPLDRHGSTTGFGLHEGKDGGGGGA